MMTGVTYGPSSVKLAKHIRKLMMRYVHRMLQRIKFKGEIEIDESMFSRKVKYRRGNLGGTEIWIFGMYSMLIFSFKFGFFRLL